jgi:lipoprotein-anchoring transpeptidase ErfK/SrfK
MPPRSLLSSIVLAGAAATLPLTAPTPAKAQSLIDFLWGGSQEWGGGKQTVSFDPKYTPGQIIVSFGDRRLYHIIAKGKATSYPIAVPREQSRWQGTTTVSSKRLNPSWRPTAEMLAENPKLPHWVPGGHPMNPLGVRALYLGSSTYRIHGTDAPWTIGQAVSKGCIRMFNKDVLDLYPRVSVGTRVTVTWQRFSTGQAVASSYDDVPTPFPPAAYDSGPPHRAVRELPPLPRSVRAAQTAAVRMEPATSSEPAAKKPTATKADDSKVAEPTRKAETDKSSSATAASSATSAAEAATRAAAAAAKAAVAAREAAETAKKAAADAKKATTGAAKEPETKAAPGRSAAL